MQEWQEKIEQKFEQFKAEMREEVRQLKEQKTEEIPAFNVNIASQDVITRLDKLEQDLDTHSDAWLKSVQDHYEDHKDDISGVQTVLKGHAKFFEEHGRRLAATSTKEDISRLETAMATKDDRATMKNEILDAMKQLLQRKSGE